MGSILLYNGIKPDLLLMPSYSLPNLDLFMIVAIDVHYRETYIKAVAIEFEDWTTDYPTKINQVILPEIAPYIPGQFYKRELPCITKVLEQSNLLVIETIIIDGYVTLDNLEKSGLGQYLYEYLEKSATRLSL